MKKKNKVLTLLLSIMMVVTMMPSVGWAGGGEVNAKTLYVSSSGSDTEGSGEESMPYATILKALTEASENDTIKLLSDIGITSKVDVGKSITIDLNGKVLTSTDLVFDLAGTKTLTLSGNGKIIGGNGAIKTNQGYNTNLILNGVEIEATGSDAIAWKSRNSKIEVVGSSINSITATTTGMDGIYAYSDYYDTIEICGTGTITISGENDGVHSVYMTPYLSANIRAKGGKYGFEQYGDGKEGIKGIENGLYSIDVSTNCKDGYICIENTDIATKTDYPYAVVNASNFSVLLKKNGNTVPYNTIADAVLAAENDLSVIKVNKDLSENISVSSNQNIILQSNGKTVTGTISAPEGTLKIQSGIYTTDPTSYLDYGYTTTNEAGKYTVVVRELVESEDGYHIATLDDLAAFRNMVNESGNTFSGKTVTLDSIIDMDAIGAWTPIGNDNTLFDGIFNGKYKKLINLKVIGDSEIKGGLFNTIGSSAKIERLWFEKANIIGKNVATLAYSSKPGSLIDRIVIKSDCKVNATSYGCGVIVDCYGDINYCWNFGNIQSKFIAGGIAGYVEGNSDSEKATIQYCVNKGTVIGDDRAGGVVACAYNAIVKNCFNAGLVKKNNASTDMPAGGIAATSNPNSEISYCKNTGDVVSVGNGDNSQAGGIVGQDGQGTAKIAYCENTGDVTAEASRASGISGSLYNTTIKYCMNSGEVKGNYAGGISAEAHYGTSSQSYCLNTGNIDSTNKLQLAESNTNGYYYEGTVLKDKDGAEVSNDVALAALNGGDNNSFFTLKDNKIVSTLEFIPDPVEPKEPVAQIGNVKYDTLAAALTEAKKTTSETNPVTVKVIGDATACKINDCKYITIQGTETGKITGYFESDAASSDLTGFKLKNIKFESGGIILSNNVTSVAGMVIDGCILDGTGAEDSAIQINKKEGVDANGLEITNNTIKNYTATEKSAILLNGKAPKAGSSVVIEGNTIENINYNAIQVLSFDNIVIKNNKISRIGHIQKAINISGSKGAIITGNEIALKAGQYAVGSVTKLNYLSKNKLTQDGSVVSDTARNAIVSTGGAASLDAYIINNKVAGGIIIKNSAEVPQNEELASGINAVKIGETIYLVGVNATATNMKVTGGKFVSNPIEYVGEDYTVKISDDNYYPYEVVTYETSDDQQTIVVEQTTETSVDNKITDAAEVKAAEKALENTEVVGVADNLTTTGRDTIIQKAIADNSDVTKATVDNAKLVDITITVEAEVTAVKTVSTSEETEKIIEFEVTPYAVVTTTATDGTQVSSGKIEVSNDYLETENVKDITVRLGCDFEPAQVIHIKKNNKGTEVFAKDSTASYENKTFTYENNIVTLKITEFSEIHLIAAEKYAKITFAAGEGSGTMSDDGVEKNTLYTLPTNGFTAPSGKEFSGWIVGTDTTVRQPNTGVEITADTTITAQWKSTSSGIGGGYIIATNPTISSDTGATYKLSTDGTKLDITVKDGYELVDVTLNGVSQGTVTTLTGLKSTDKVVITTKKVEKEEISDKTEVKKAISGLKIRANSKYVMKNGKRYIQVYTTILKGKKSLENLLNNGYTAKYVVYRSTKTKDSSFKKLGTSTTGKYVDKTGKNGTYYYYKVVLKVYDENKKLVSSTVIGQCKYGSRMYNTKGKVN